MIQIHLLRSMLTTPEKSNYNKYTIIMLSLDDKNLRGSFLL